MAFYVRIVGPAGREYSTDAEGNLVGEANRATFDSFEDADDFGYSHWKEWGHVVYDVQEVE